MCNYYVFVLVCLQIVRVVEQESCSFHAAQTIFYCLKGRREGETLKESYKLFQQIITERGLSSYRVAMDSKVPQSAFSLWKLHDIVPKYDRMKRIAAALSTPERPLTANSFLDLDIDQ